jgi:hypothetical protein
MVTGEDVKDEEQRTRDKTKDVDTEQKTRNERRRKLTVGYNKQIFPSSFKTRVTRTRRELSWGEAIST